MTKRKKHKKKKIYESMKTKLVQNGLADSHNIVIQPSGELKMSEVLLDFIEPYLEPISVAIKISR